MTRTRSPLLAGAVLGGLLAALAPVQAPAWAQMPVTDAGALVQLAQQAQTATNTLSTLQQQYNRLTQTYEALAHPTGVGGLFPGLSAPSVQNPLGGVAQLPGVLGGSASPSALAQQFATSNRYYQPQGSDTAAQEMQRQSQATAGVQALAYQNLQATQARMQELPGIQSQLDNAQTLQDVAAVNNRLQVEQQFVATQQAQAQQLQLLQQAQMQVNDQRAQERRRQDADRLFNDTQALN